MLLIIIMECYNLSSYIDDIHGWCGNDLNNVITQCQQKSYGSTPGLVRIVVSVESCRTGELPEVSTSIGVHTPSQAPVPLRGGLAMVQSLPQSDFKWSDERVLSPYATDAKIE
eukprot:SAG22_NODE_714_length_7722_cov_3.919585_9_plen_113_part_00